MPRKKKNDDPIEEETKKGGKKGKGNKKDKEPEEDIKVEAISIGEALALLEEEEKNGKKGKKDPYKGMDIHERNLKDPSKFLFRVNHTTYVVEKVSGDSLQLSTQLGLFAYGICDSRGKIVLIDSLDRESAYHVWLHEATHAIIFQYDITMFDEDEYRFNDEAICQFTANFFEFLSEASSEFLKSAFYLSFKKADY